MVNYMDYVSECPFDDGNTRREECKSCRGFELPVPQLSYELHGAL